MTQSTQFTGEKEVLNIDHLFADRAQLARIRAESKFGSDEIASILAELPDGARVLEVGCGTGYLLAQLANAYPNLSFTGLEPIGQGFAQFEHVLAAVSKVLHNVQIIREPIETHIAADSNYDLVFSVNVYEHLDDWRQGINAAMELLSNHGRLVVLCPNYTFPYEPHFGIPLLFGPRATRKIFARRIEGVERRIDSSGLWNSLNFITVAAVIRHCRFAEYKVSFDKSISRRMVDRLSADKEFAARQGLIGKLFSTPISPVRILTYLPAALSPYMKATISKR